MLTITDLSLQRGGVWLLENVNLTVQPGQRVAIVGANLEVKVREQKRLAALHLAKENVLVGHIADVTPHGQVLDEHLKEVGVVDGLLERLKLVHTERDLAKLPPLDAVLEGNFERRRLSAIPGDALSEALLVLEAGLALLPGDGIFGIFLNFVVVVAVGEGVVPVRFRRVIERSDFVDNNVDGCVGRSPSGVGWHWEIIGPGVVWGAVEQKWVDDK